MGYSVVQQILSLTAISPYAGHRKWSALGCCCDYSRDCRGAVQEDSLQHLWGQSSLQCSWKSSFESCWRRSAAGKLCKGSSLKAAKTEYFSIENGSHESDAQHCVVRNLLNDATEAVHWATLPEVWACFFNFDLWFTWVRHRHWVRHRQSRFGFQQTSSAHRALIMA